MTRVNVYHYHYPSPPKKGTFIKFIGSGNKLCYIALDEGYEDIYPLSSVEFIDTPKTLNIPVDSGLRP